MKATVMPETPSVISVGELWMDSGHSFRWATNRAPRLLLPHGRRLELSVEGKIPHLNHEWQMGPWVM
eukprot:760728-Pyramimonas_sp.AAC.1